jgi:hypothetical protein
MRAEFMEMSKFEEKILKFALILRLINRALKPLRLTLNTIMIPKDKTLHLKDA